MSLQCQLSMSQASYMTATCCIPATFDDYTSHNHVDCLPCEQLLRLFVL